MTETFKKRNKDVRQLDVDVWTLALERMERVYQLFDHVFVSFSGGKDSTATLQVALEVATYLDKLPLRAVFYDEEAIPIQTAEYVDRLRQRDDIEIEWLCLPVKHRNACSRRSPWWYPFDPDCPEKWVRELPINAIQKLDGFPLQPAEARLSIPDANGLLAPPKLGNVCMLMGIRAEESITRHRAVTRRVNDNWIIPYDGATSNGNLTKAYPIYDWKTPDVWTAPNKFGWDYNRAYDVMEMAGLTHSQQRCSPAFGEEPLQKLWTYAHCFPEIWDKMTDRVPGAAAAARYALTELYGYRGRPDKPSDMSWEEWLSYWIEKWPEDKQHLVAKRVREEISKHFLKTADPIMPRSPHPLSGVSWDFVTMIAMRGDLKTRKSPLAAIKSDNLAHYWQKYNEERMEVEAVEK